MNQDINQNEEFTSPDMNLLILLKELQDELEAIQLDLTVIRSPIVRGMAQEKYLELKKEYFYLLAEDLKLLKLYDTAEMPEQSEDGFTPM